MNEMINVTFFVVPHITNQVQTWLEQAVAIASKWDGVEAVRLYRVLDTTDSVNYALQLDTADDTRSQALRQGQLRRLTVYATGRWGQQVTAFVTTMQRLA